jgi:hypothetical protein
MGNLKPGVKYVYEHDDGITYAREFGVPHGKRFEIGRTIKKQSLIDDLREQKLWGDIHRAAKTNPLLQEALERAILIYHLSEKNGEK